MRTGIEGLDCVLCGGFLYHNSILIKGAPGCGKTTLGIQILYNGVVQSDEPGIIVLFEQFPQQLYRDLMSYNWNLSELVQQNRLRIIFSTPEDAMAKDKTSEPPLIAQIQDAAAEIGAKRILVDSVTHILNAAADSRHARELLMRFINHLKTTGLTPIMTAESEDREGAIGVDEYLSDCVLLLSSESGKDRSFNLRELRVRKTRGHDHLRGRHVFKLSDAGVEVFPLSVTGNPCNGSKASARTALDKVHSGVSGLDLMLGGGYTRGTSTIIAGMPGTFKTTLAAQFAAAAAGDGEKALIISFAERAAFLARLMEEKGIPVQKQIESGNLQIWHYTPKEIYIEELLSRLSRELSSSPMTRLVIDGINDIERSIDRPEAYKDVLAAFLSVCTDHNVTSLFTQKLDKFTGNAPLTDIRYASMFDGVIYLGTIEIESSVHKVISILKMRGGHYQSDLREIDCGHSGLEVQEKFVGMTGVLSGNAHGHYKKTVEELFQPLYFIRDFLEILATGEPDAEQSTAIVHNLRDESNKLVDKLKTHFDIKA
ncbi:MAG: ATPase domain-containing protein [Candidatus Sumerlaeaceae bacterium]